MQCMKTGCSNPLKGRQATFCSDKCRMAQTRTEPKSNTKVTKVEHKVPAYELVPDEKVYSRPAVRYKDPKDLREVWDTRPEPLSPDDIPKPLNRGKYIRPDGSEYQFDACGKVFECECMIPPDAWDECLPETIKGDATFHTTDDAPDVSSKLGDIDYKGE